VEAHQASGGAVDRGNPPGVLQRPKRYTAADPTPKIRTAATPNPVLRQAGGVNGAMRLFPMGWMPGGAAGAAEEGRHQDAAVPEPVRNAPPGEGAGAERGYMGNPRASTADRSRPRERGSGMARAGKATSKQWKREWARQV
jgi:hypothetical protein